MRTPIYNTTLYPYADVCPKSSKQNNLGQFFEICLPSKSIFLPKCFNKPITLNLEAFLQHLRASTSRPKNTVKTAKSILNSFIQYLQNNQVQVLSQELIEKYLGQFNSPATKYAILSFLRKFFDYLNIPDNPARKISLPAVNRGVGIKYLEEHEIIRLLKILQKQIKNGQCLREHAIIMLILFSGLRVNEVLALKTDDWKDNEIFIRDSKNHEGRIVFIPDEVIDSIKNYHTKYPCNSPYVFCPINNTVNPLGYSSPWDRIKPIFKKAGINGKSLHSLRHTFSRILSLAGYRREQIQVFLGHKDIRTTEIYTKVFNYDVFKCFPDVHKVIRRYIRISKKF